MSRDRVLDDFIDRMESPAPAAATPWLEHQTPAAACAAPMNAVTHDPAAYGSGYLDGLDEGKQRADIRLILVTAFSTLIAAVAIIALAIHLGGAA